MSDKEKGKGEASEKAQKVVVTLMSRNVRSIERRKKQPSSFNKTLQLLKKFETMLIQWSKLSSKVIQESQQKFLRFAQEDLPAEKVRVL